MNTTEFIEKARSIHGDRYWYGKTEFAGMSKKLVITCPTHGDFQALAFQHLRGRNCIKCAGKAKLTREEFIEKAKAVHGERYDYSRVNYLNNSTPVEVVCPEHGPFFPKPVNHIANKSGCPACAGCQRVTQQEFIRRSRLVHGDKYDYSKSEFRTVDDKVSIICPEHGQFEQVAYDHMKGRGCIKCGVIKCSSSQRLGTKEFIRRAVALHGNRYDYSRSKYTHIKGKVEIICKEHGPFWQMADGHTIKHGCPQCAGLAPVSKEQFIERSVAAHGDEYDYSETVYTSFSKPASIRCKTHGVFWQVAKTHASGHGCPKCAREATTSAGENEVAEWLKSAGFNIVRNDRDVLEGFEIDIYIPSRKIGIEFNGAYWHHDARLVHPRIHETKAARADKVGIGLVTVWDFDWMNKRELVQAMLLHRMGVGKVDKINARECHVLPVDSKGASEFYDRTHIQGAAWRSIANYGLFSGDIMVACMSFSRGASRRGKTGSDEWELTRYSTDGVVRGGAGKLLAEFIREHAPHAIWSFSDRQHFSGGLYRLLGFMEDGKVAADYRVMHQPSGRVWHKSAWQRRHIAARLAELGMDDVFNPETDKRTEREMQALAGCIRIMDSGKTRWLLDFDSGKLP